MRRLPLCALSWLVLAVAGCVPPIPQAASEYHATEPDAPLVLRFAPHAAVLSPADLARLRALRPTLPVQTLPELYAAGPLAALRARAVRNALDRPVIVYLQAAAKGPNLDEAVLLLPMPAGILPDACRGPGEFDAGDIWPGDDARRTRFLPAGCATAANIQVQAADGNDLLRGRPLPAGASIPFADAIERYYRRNEPGQNPAGGSGGGGPSPGGTLVQSAGTIPAPPVNPLLGPLPGAAPLAGASVQ